MEILVLLAVAGIAVGLAWFARIRHRRRTSVDRSPEAAAERKAAAARKELIRRFPERDLDSRVRVTKQIADLEPGDVVEYPATGDAEDHDRPKHVIFTGFTDIGGRDFVGICDLDGFGTRTVDLPLSDEVTAYVLPTTEA